MDDPRHTHAWEQFMATTTELAAALAGYMLDLMDHGFTREEAVRLTEQMQAILLIGSQQKNQGEEWE